jgi:hypothetical protein
MAVTREEDTEFKDQLRTARAWMVQLGRNTPGDPLLEVYSEAISYIEVRWDGLTRNVNAIDTAKGLIAEIAAVNSGLYKLERSAKEAGTYKNVAPDDTLGDAAYDALIAGKHGVQEAAAAAGAAVDSAKSAIPWIGLGLLGVGITVLVIAVSRK